jgi:hypothetical protein
MKQRAWYEAACLVMSWAKWFRGVRFVKWRAEGTLAVPKQR